MQPSQQNQAKLPESRTADAKSKAANFRAVETKLSHGLLPFKVGEQTAIRLLRLDAGGFFIWARALPQRAPGRLPFISW